MTDMKKNIIYAVLCAFCVPLAGCGGLKVLKVNDFTEQRVTDLSLTKKVTGKRNYLFFSTTKMGIFLDGSIQGMITDYQGNPIEGVTVKVVPESGKGKAGGEGDVFAMGGNESVAAVVNLSFAPGITDSMGLYKIHFSLPVLEEEVELYGKLVYNPGWDQQKINLGKAYEPQQKETSFRLYYNMDSGFLAFAEGVRKVIVEAVGEGKGRMSGLPGAKAPGTMPSASQPAGATPQNPAAASAEEDLFKGFDFGQ